MRGEGREKDDLARQVRDTFVARSSFERTVSNPLKIHRPFFAMSIRSYRDLKVWQKAMDLAVAAYHLTWKYPTDQRYGLSSQTQRAGVSVPANIAEGHAVGQRKPFRRHLRIARGSLAELETHVLLAERLNYVPAQASTEFHRQSSEVSRMLSGLLRSLGPAE